MPMESLDAMVAGGHPELVSASFRVPAEPTGTPLGRAIGSSPRPAEVFRGDARSEPRGRDRHREGRDRLAGAGPDPRLSAGSRGGRSSVWLERQVVALEAAGSNPVAHPLVPLCDRGGFVTRRQDAGGASRQVTAIRATTSPDSSRWTARATASVGSSTRSGGPASPSIRIRPRAFFS